MPAHRFTDLAPWRRRRWLQAAGLAALGLAGCGGGGAGGAEGGAADTAAAGADGTPATGASGSANPTQPAPVPGAAPGPSGTLVYRNGSMGAVWRFASGTALRYEPGTLPSVRVGSTVSPQGQIVNALEDDLQGFGFEIRRLDGSLVANRRLNRPLAFMTSAMRFDAAGTRVAFSVDEPTSSTVDERIARTLVLSWPEGTLLAQFDGWEKPVFAGSGLLLRQPDSGRLRLVDAAYADQGWLADIHVDTTAGGCTASADGRQVLWSDGPLLRAYDRQTATPWVAAQRTVSDLRSPCLSPDGRWLALLTLDQASLQPAPSLFYTEVPHVLPFNPGQTVTVESARHAIRGPLAECIGPMGWTLAG